MTFTLKSGCDSATSSLTIFDVVRSVVSTDPKIPFFDVSISFSLTYGSDNRRSMFVVFEMPFTTSLILLSSSDIL